MEHSPRRIAPPASIRDRAILWSAAVIAVAAVLPTAVPARALGTENRGGLVYDIGADDSDPRFVFGAWVEVEDGIAGRDATLDTLAPAGVSPLWNMPGGSTAVLNGMEALLDRAEADGLDVMFELFGASPANDALFNRPALFDHPAVLGYYHSDDVGDPNFNGITPASLRQRNAAVKSRNADRITAFSYGSGTPFSQATIDAYADGADVVMRQVYPVGNAPIGTAFDLMDAVTQAVSDLPTPGVPMAVIQTFNWADQGSPGLGTRAPTAEEVAAMSYLTLIAGSKGLYFYSFAQGLGATSGLNLTAPALWDEILDIKEQTQAVSSLLLLGERDVLLESSTIHVGLWRDGEAWSVIAVDSRTTGGERTVDLRVGDALRSASAIVRGGMEQFALTELGLRLKLMPGDSVVVRSVRVIPEPGAALAVAIMGAACSRGNRRRTISRWAPRSRA